MEIGEQKARPRETGKQRRVVGGVNVRWAGDDTPDIGQQARCMGVGVRCDARDRVARVPDRAHRARHPGHVQRERECDEFWLHEPELEWDRPVFGDLYNHDTNRSVFQRHGYSGPDREWDDEHPDHRRDGDRGWHVDRDANRHKHERYEQRGDLYWKARR